jgi:hypothetical protein
VTVECGGCRGLGAHQRYCPRHPNYHPWRRLADQAENIGDTIGANDTAVANMAYGLAGRIRRLIEEHPWRSRL